MIEMILRLKGYHYARLLAFISFLSLIVLTWLVLLDDSRFGDGDVILAAIAFLLMGLISGSVASTEESKMKLT